MAKQRVRLTPATRPAVLQAIAQAPDGYYVLVEEAKRNLEQNAKMWAMLSDIARQVVWTVNGHAEKLTPEEWKTILTASLRQEQRMAPGIRGGLVMLGASTREMTIREMTEVIEILYAFGSEHDVIWSERVAVPGWLQ